MIIVLRQHRQVSPVSTVLGVDGSFPAEQCAGPASLLTSKCFCKNGVLYYRAMRSVRPPCFILPGVMSVPGCIWGVQSRSWATLGAWISGIQPLLFTDVFKNVRVLFLYVCGFGFFFNNSFFQIIWDRESYSSRQPTYPLTPFFHISVEGLVMFDFFSLKMSLEMARIALNVTRSAMWRSLSLFLGLQGCCLCWSFPGCLGWDCHHPQPTSEGQAFSCGGLQWWILKTRHKIFWQNSFSSKNVLHYAYPPSFL